MSHSNVDVVMRYIADQEEHHRQHTFTEELQKLSIGTDCAGATKKAVKTVNDVQRWVASA
jgi:hypothetical protein